MKLLLDTHILLWWLADDRRLPAAVRGAIIEPTTRVAVSAATAWEIGIKQALGKLEAPDDLEEQLAVARFTAVPVTIPDGLAAARLPRHHDDPFDRMLIAQAVTRDLMIATVDARFVHYGVPLLPS